jgi:hypothetical protein
METPRTSDGQNLPSSPPGAQPKQWVSLPHHGGAQPLPEDRVTTIKASCHVCGDVELKPAQLRLVVCSRVEWSYYAFTCPTCRDEVRKPADEEIVALLVSGGVVAEHWIIPAEALEEHDGARITYDDVLDFALGLDRVDLLAAMISPRVGA